MAYKQLSRTQHIDPGLLAAVKGAVRPAGPPGSQVAPPTGVPPGAPPSSTPSATAGPMGAAIRPPSVATSQPSPAPTPPAPSTPTPSRADIPSAPTPTSSSGPATPAPSGAESRPGTAPPPNGEVKTESTEESSATKEEVKSEPSQEPSTPAPPEGAEEPPKDGETPKAIWTEKEEPPVERGTDLAELLRDKRPGYGQHKITPMQKPKGIDPRNGSILLHSNLSQIKCCIFICNPLIGILFEKLKNIKTIKVLFYLKMKNVFLLESSNGFMKLKIFQLHYQKIFESELKLNFDLFVFLVSSDNYAKML